MKRLQTFLAQFDWGALVGTVLAAAFYLCVVGPVIVNSPVLFGATEQQQQATTDDSEKQPQISQTSGSDEALARYTFWLVVFTGVLGVATIGLWIVTAKTLRHAQDDAERQARDMRSSISAANTSAGAAEDALRHAKESSERQLRAYVLVCHATQQQRTDSSFIYRVAFKNYGQTPAYNVVIQRRIIWSPPVEPDFGKDRMEVFPSVTIGPGGEMQFTLISPAPLNSEDFLKVMSGEKRFYVLGRANYTDAFDQRRETSFDLASHTDSAGELLLSPREGGKNYSN